MKKKKFLCFFLVLMLCFSSTISAYASSGSRGGGGTSFGESEKESSSGGEHGGGNLSFDSDEEKHTFAYNLGQFLMKSALVPADIVVGGVDAIGDFVQSKLDYWNEKGWLGMSGGKLYFNGSATKDINNYLQSAIHLYDGFYRFDPTGPLDPDLVAASLLSFYGVDVGRYSVSDYDKFVDSVKNSRFIIMTNKDFNFNGSKAFSGNSNIIKNYPNSYLCLDTNSSSKPIGLYDLDKSSFLSVYDYCFRFSNNLTGGWVDSIANTSFYKDTSRVLAVYANKPVDIFTSVLKLRNYLSNGRSYLPEFPDNITIPKKYIDDPSLLPDITYNVDKSNKTENAIQNEYNTIINNYITNLGGSSSGGSGSGGESGGGSGSGGSSGGGNITDTELYDFLTKLWNESDKKFDKMIDLLETNNKYQKKLVDSLNDIKAILVTEAVFNAFKDRSSQTADKAKDKFPTSIPWDVAMVINAMSAEPEQLKFSLPIQVKSIGINETIDIDLSSEEWEKLAKTCRYLLSITFILFLIHLTRKMFGGGDD